MHKDIIYALEGLHDHAFNIGNCLFANAEEHELVDDG